MSIPSSTDSAFRSKTSTGGDHAGNAFDTVATSAQHTLDSALDSLSGTAEGLRSKAAPAIDRISARAEAAAKRGIEAVRDGSHQLRDKATRASDSTIAYVKDEPVKAVLVAAATGAFLMGLLSLMTRSRKA